MTRLRESTLTVPEAAYVADMTERIVNHEIDAQIVPSQGRRERRALSGVDVLYLGAIRGLREHMAPKLRKQLRDAISSAVVEARAVAKVAAFEVKIAAIEQEVLGNFTALERMKRKHIESRREILAGEPVIRGTRIAARLIADLVKRGIPRTE